MATRSSPRRATFNDADQEWHYALSWMAFDYIAATDGESRLWELVEAMHNGGEGTRDSQQDRVLLQVLGYDGHGARRPPRGSAPSTAESRGRFPR